MGVNVTIELFGDQQMSREIKRIGERADNLDPAFRSIFDRLMEINAEQLWSQGSRGGSPYDPLAPSTIAAKERAGYRRPGMALFATEDLFEALTSPSSPNNEMIFNGDWAVFRVTGEPGEYGPYHQGGTSRMPARPPFKLTEQDKADFIKEMAFFLFRGEVRNFL